MCEASGVTEKATVSAGLLIVRGGAHLENGMRL